MDFSLRTLLAEQYAPITSQIGFVAFPFDEAAELLAAWRRGLDRDTTVKNLTPDGFPFAFHHLEPLTMPGHPRELLVEFGSWTAYFDNGLHGSDPIGPVGYLCEVAQVKGLAICAVPDAGRRLGAVKWELFAERPMQILNYERTIALVHESSKWVFETTGQPLPFEHLERYEARRPRDRFDSALVESYSQALGLDVFNPGAYGPRIAMVESHPRKPDPPPVRSMTLDQAQAEQGITPGRADTLPG